MSSSVLKVINGAMSRGRFHLPLLTVILLPFYSMPNAGLFTPMLQMQFFQIMVVLCFCFKCADSKAITIFHPFRWLVYFAILGLALFPLRERMMVYLQMIIISYVFFECIVYSNMSMETIRKSFVFLLIATAIYSAKQNLNVHGFMPDYLCLDRNPLNKNIMFVAGIWTVQAYCGAFVAMCIVLFCLSESKWKYAIILICTVIMYKTHSIFAWGGAVVGISWILFLKFKSEFALKIVGAILVSFVAYYFLFEFGDGSSEAGRMLIWKATFKESLNRFWGHGLGSFMKFGFDTTLNKLNAPNLFFGHAHNQILQMWYEMGVPGLVVTLGFIVRTLWLGWKYSYNQNIITLSAVTLTIMAISMGQPVFHVMHITAVAILIFGMLELEVIREREQLCS